MYVHTYCTCRRGGEEWEGVEGEGGRQRRGVGEGGRDEERETG